MGQEEYKTLNIFSYSPQNRHEHLCDVLSFIHNSRSLSEFRTIIEAQQPAHPVRDISLTRLEAMDLIHFATEGDRIGLSERGHTILSGDIEPLVEALCETFVGFYDIIEILSIASHRISTIREYVNEAHDLAWSGNREPKQRVDWLRDMGLATLNDSNEYHLTATGQNIHDSLRESRGPPAIVSLFTREQFSQFSTEHSSDEIVESSDRSNTETEELQTLQTVLDSADIALNTDELFKDAQQISERDQSSSGSDLEDKTVSKSEATEPDEIPLTDRSETKIISLHVNKSDEMIDRYEETVMQGNSISELDGVEAESFPRDAVRYWETKQGQLDEVGGIVRGDVLLFHHYDDGYLSAGRVLSIRETTSDNELSHAVLFERISMVDVEVSELFGLLDWDAHPKGRWIRIDDRDAVTAEYGSVDDFADALEGEERFDYWAHSHWDLDESLARRLARQLERKGQAILYGPPGTGKTFSAERFASWWTGKQSGTQPTHSQTESITFHPSYTYEDFVEGYTISEKDSQSTQEQQSDTDRQGSPYGLEPGIFKTFCDTAREVSEETDDGRSPPRYVLVIDELNRGNVTRIFGENITLLEKDKRGNTRQLSYSGTEFSVPENVYLIGTMNTADQSITRLDAAVRRRFAAIATPPEYEVLYNVSDSLYPNDRESAYELVDSGRADTETLVAASILALEIINKRLIGVPGLGKGKRLGHAYLLPEAWQETDEAVSDDTALADVWRYDILPLLEEYFFEDLETLQERIFKGEAELVDPETNDIMYMEPPQLRETLTTFVVDHRQLLSIELEDE